MPECVAHIPHKDWADEERERMNYATIEQWSRQVHDHPVAGRNAVPLHIPQKEWSGDRLERENYLAIERWSQLFQIKCIKAGSISTQWHALIDEHPLHLDLRTGIGPLAVSFLNGTFGIFGSDSGNHLFYEVWAATHTLGSFVGNTNAGVVARFRSYLLANDLASGGILYADASDGTISWFRGMTYTQGGGMSLEAGTGVSLSFHSGHPVALSNTRAVGFRSQGGSPSDVRIATKQSGSWVSETHQVVGWPAFSRSYGQTFALSPTSFLAITSTAASSSFKACVITVDSSTPGSFSATAGADLSLPTTGFIFPTVRRLSGNQFFVVDSTRNYYLTVSGTSVSLSNNRAQAAGFSDGIQQDPNNWLTTTSSRPLKAVYSGGWVYDLTHVSVDGTISLSLGFPLPGQSDRFVDFSADPISGGPLQFQLLTYPFQSNPGPPVGPVGPCALFIPHKRWAYGSTTKQRNPELEEDNYNYLEAWAKRFIMCFNH